MLTYLDYFKLDCVVAIFGALADGLDYGVDKQPVSLAVLRCRLLAFLIVAIVWAIAIKEVVAEQLLNPVKKLLDKARQFRLNSHFEDVEVLVGAQLLIILICLYLLYNRRKRVSLTLK